MPLTRPRAGELKTTVRIISHTSAPVSPSGDVTGPVIGDYGRLVRTVRGKLETVGALTYWGAVQAGESVTHKLYMWSIPGVSDVRSLTQVTEFDIEGETYRLVRCQTLPGVPSFVCCDVTNAGKTDIAHVQEGLEPLGGLDGL